MKVVLIHVIFKWRVKNIPQTCICHICVCSNQLRHRHGWVGNNISHLWGVVSSLLPYWKVSLSNVWNTHDLACGVIFHILLPFENKMLLNVLFCSCPSGTLKPLIWTNSFWRIFKGWFIYKKDSQLEKNIWYWIH